MIPLWLSLVLIIFTIGPGMWIILYFISDMYTQDQLLDMWDSGKITEKQYCNLYEKAILGEYKLYPSILKKMQKEETA